MKFFDFVTPTGVKGNLGNAKDIGSMVLGVVVMIGVLAVGQSVAKKIDAVLPANTSNIEPFTKAQVVQTNDGGVII